MYLDMSSSAVSSCSIRRNTWTCKVNEGARASVNGVCQAESSEDWFSPARLSSWATVRSGVEATYAGAELERTGTPERGGWAPEGDAGSPPDALKKTHTHLFQLLECWELSLRWTCVCSVRGFTLYVWQVFLVLVNFAAVDGESQAFEQHGSLLQFSISVGKQAQRAALGDCNPGWRKAKVVQGHK